MSYDFKTAEGFHFAIEKACASMPLNETVRILERDRNAIMALQAALNEIGQYKFVNLTSRSKESMTAIALYSGDGIVTKIIPRQSLSNSEGVIYHLPAITTMAVHTEDNDLVIKTYPYVSPSGVTQEEVNAFGDLIAQVGMYFNANDGMPKNVHRLPDDARTFIGIDSDMYHYGKEGSFISEDMRKAWHNYIYELFPIYEFRQIPEQTDSTNFNFLSIHDPSKTKSSFDASLFFGATSQKTQRKGGDTSGRQDSAPDEGVFFEI